MSQNNVNIPVAFPLHMRQQQQQQQHQQQQTLLYQSHQPHQVHAQLQQQQVPPHPGVFQNVTTLPTPPQQFLIGHGHPVHPAHHHHMRNTPPSSSASSAAVSHRPSPKMSHSHSNGTLDQRNMASLPVALPSPQPPVDYSSSSSGRGAPNHTTNRQQKTKRKPSQNQEPQPEVPPPPTSLRRPATPKLADSTASVGSVTPPPQTAGDSVESSGTERDAHRIQQRQKQILFGKVTDGYRQYVRCVPHKLRDSNNTRHPVTPRIDQLVSKRTWDNLVGAWRRALHEWDAGPTPEDELHVQDVVRNPKKQVEAGGVWTQSRLQAYREGIDHDLRALVETVQGRYPPNNTASGNSPPPSDAESPAMGPSPSASATKPFIEPIALPQQQKHHSTTFPPTSSAGGQPAHDGDISSDETPSRPRSGKKKKVGRSVSQSPGTHVRSRSTHSPVWDLLDQQMLQQQQQQHVQQHQQFNRLVVTIIQQQTPPQQHGGDTTLEPKADQHTSRTAPTRLDPTTAMMTAVECDIALDCAPTASYDIIMENLKQTRLDLDRLTFHEPQMLPSSDGLHIMRSPEMGSSARPEDDACETRQCNLHPAGSLCKIYALSTVVNQRRFAARCAQMSSFADAPRIQLFSPDCSPLFTLPSRQRDSAVMTDADANRDPNGTPKTLRQNPSPSPVADIAGAMQGLVFATHGLNNLDMILPPSLRYANEGGAPQNAAAISTSRDPTPLLFNVRSSAMFQPTAAPHHGFNPF